jgi:hypothetical protein
MHCLYNQARTLDGKNKNLMITLQQLIFCRDENASHKRLFFLDCTIEQRKLDATKTFDAHVAAAEIWMHWTKDWSFFACDSCLYNQRKKLDTEKRF